MYYIIKQLSSLAQPIRSLNYRTVNLASSILPIHLKTVSSTSFTHHSNATPTKRFFSSESSSEPKNSTITKQKDNHELGVNYWPPATSKGRAKPHPFLAIGMGDVGHISLTFKDHEGVIYNLSLWPRELKDEDPFAETHYNRTIKIGTLSASHEDDIKAEGNRPPIKKAIALEPWH